MESDTIVRSKKKVKTRRWPNQIDLADYETFADVFLQNEDSTLLEWAFLHTSHDYINLYVKFINNQDTIIYVKSKPIDCNSIWVKNRVIAVKSDPGIYLKLVALLPDEFLLRDELASYSCE